MAVVGVVLTGTTLLEIDTESYVASRSSAIFDAAIDPTSSWRLDLWTSNLALWRLHPLAGAGFGGYYLANATQSVSTTTPPHSLFMQTLVVMGVIGLGTCLAVVILVGMALWRALKVRGSARGPSLDHVTLELGLGVLISAQFYWSVYSLDYYSCLWVGLALAATFGLRRAAAGSNIQTR